MLTIRSKKYPEGCGESGFSLIYTVILIFILSLVLLGALQFATNEARLVRSTANREQAFQIAEAGVNYYQWHLAHFPTDYWDGNASTTPGPYTHNYVDEDTQKVIGQYKLTITPPSVGSTIVTVKSTGYTFLDTSATRSVTVRYGVPSLAKYSFVTNSDIWIGSDEHVSGALHSNGGIRFDGTTNAPVTSAKQTYTCQSWSGSPCPHTENGIWGSAPASTQAFWQFPMPNVDFSSLTSDLATMKSTAQTDGTPAYLPQSNKYGYDLVFGANGKVNIYLVKSLRSISANAYDINGNAVNQSIDYDSSQLQLLYNQVSLPASGVFYIEDNVWVEGTVSGRVQVVAARLPYNASTAPNIYIPNNIKYNVYDGSCVLGLVSQKNIVVTYYAPSTIEIDAAMIAQNGSVEVYQYSPGDVNDSITVLGSIGTYGQWTWTYVDGGGNTISGYQNTYTNYDGNLLFGPPPSFPLSTSGYQQMSWTSN